MVNIRVYFPGNSGLRFSRNACVPSLKSAVPKHFPNSVISVSKPFSPSSNPAFTELMAAATATDEFFMICTTTFERINSIVKAFL